MAIIRDDDVEGGVEERVLEVSKKRNTKGKTVLWNSLLANKGC